MSAAADSNPPGELYCTACEKTFHVGERCPTDGTRLLKLKARIDPFLGRDIDGRFTILEKLGSGGMGAVYRAEQHSVDREVAIKVVNSSLVSEPEVIKRFLREAKLASRLTHPNAVGVLDFGQTEDGVFYLVMELVSGRTLDDVIKAEHVFKPERVVRIGIQICDALEGAHELSIIHRDLKPSNIMLMASGRDLVKVLDFGLAKSTSPDQTSTTMTGAGAVVGTPAFMPPELATGEPCDARSDLYSLGVILYLLGSGRLPFMSDSVHELLSMHACDDPAPPMTGVPAKLARVIDKLLAKKPANRYQSAHEARSALEDALNLSTPTPFAAEAWPNDTNPSLGPFPATTAQFAGLQTPVPPSLVAERRKPSNTAVQRMMTGETMLAASADPVPATSQPGLSTPGFTAPAKKRWPLIAGAGAVALVATIAIAFSMRGGDETPPDPKPRGEITQPITQPPIADPSGAKPAGSDTGTPAGSAQPIATELGSDAGSAKAPEVVGKPLTVGGSKPPKGGTKPPKGGTKPPKGNGAGSGSAAVKVIPPPNTGNNTGSGAKPETTGTGIKPPF
ncbi:MAG: protein kinase [Myxococcales bacterium]|nr:protein kinase [Myxococcales bacterium]